MKIYYTIILMFLFQTAMGQTMSDSIVFHGKIVNDGILYNIGFILRIKNNPKFGSPIVGLDSSEFFVQCVRGDTLVLKTMASPYSYSVEFVAKDTIQQNIHVWGFPNSCKEWYFEQKYKTISLPIKYGINRSDLVGIYKHRKKKSYNDFYVTYDATIKLKSDSTFEFMEIRDEWDIIGVTYHTGKWEIKRDTIICRTVPELYPPIVQERYPGQVLHFYGGGWEDDKQKAIEKGIVYKFLIQKKGLIYKDNRKDRDIYRKVKQSVTTKDSI